MKGKGIEETLLFLRLSVRRALSWYHRTWLRFETILFVKSSDSSSVNAPSKAGAYQSKR